MSYTINNFQFITVKFHQEHGVGEVQRFIEEIINNFEDDQRERILVDTRCAEISDKVFNITELMKKFESFGVSKNVKIAVLRKSSGGKYHGVMKSAVNSEGYLFNLFTDFEEAGLWLTEV